jgi:hypothetical protein
MQQKQFAMYQAKAEEERRQLAMYQARQEQEQAQTRQTLANAFELLASSQGRDRMPEGVNKPYFTGKRPVNS